MNYALMSHDPTTVRITVHDLPTVAVIRPVEDRDERMWDTSVAIRLSNGTTMHDTDPGHALIEVLGLYAEDGGTPRWRRRATGLPVPERNEAVIVRPRTSDRQDTL